MYDGCHIESDRRDPVLLDRARRRVSRRIHKDVEQLLDKWIPFDKLPDNITERARLRKTIKKLFSPHLDIIIAYHDFVPVWPAEGERNDY